MPPEIEISIEPSLALSQDSSVVVPVIEMVGGSVITTSIVLVQPVLLVTVTV